MRILQSTAQARSVKVKDFSEGKWSKAALDKSLARKRADQSLDFLLTDDEYLSLQAHTSNLYREINPPLRAGKADEWNSMTTDKNTEAALEKIYSVLEKQKNIQKTWVFIHFAGMTG